MHLMVKCGCSASTVLKKNLAFANLCVCQLVCCSVQKRKESMSIGLLSDPAAASHHSTFFFVVFHPLVTGVLFSGCCALICIRGCYWSLLQATLMFQWKREGNPYQGNWFVINKPHNNSGRVGGKAKERLWDWSAWKKGKGGVAAIYQFPYGLENSIEGTYSPFPTMMKLGCNQ